MDEATRELMPSDAYCLGCRYALRGLDRHRCPECGRGFDPADPATYGDGARPRWDAGHHHAAASFLMMVGGLCAWPTLVVLLPLAVGSALTGMRKATSQRGYRAARMALVVAVAALAIGAIAIMAGLPEWVSDRMVRRLLDEQRVYWAMAVLALAVGASGTAVVRGAAPARVVAVLVLALSGVGLGIVIWFSLMPR